MFGLPPIIGPWRQFVYIWIYIYINIYPRRSPTYVCCRCPEVAGSSVSRRASLGALQVASSSSPWDSRPVPLLVFSASVFVLVAIYNTSRRRSDGGRGDGGEETTRSKERYTKETGSHEVVDINDWLESIEAKETPMRCASLWPNVVWMILSEWKVEYRLPLSLLLHP